MDADCIPHPHAAKAAVSCKLQYCFFIITILFMNCKRERLLFHQSLLLLFGQGAKIREKILQDKKVLGKLQIRVDKTNRIWYSVLATKVRQI